MSVEGVVTMKTFLVLCCYGDVICGAFDSRKGAEAGLAECKERDNWYGEYFIVEYVTNSLDAFFEGREGDDDGSDIHEDSTSAG
jgi:hypothetical protein